MYDLIHKIAIPAAIVLVIDDGLSYFLKWSFLDMIPPSMLIVKTIVMGLALVGGAVMAMEYYEKHKKDWS